MTTSSGYLTVPIEVDEDVLAQGAFDNVASEFPGWLPADGDPMTRLIRANASMAADNRIVASAVPDAIFRSAGLTLFNIPPIDASSATGALTITVQDTVGYTIPAGTQFGFPVGNGDLAAFQSISDVVIAPDASATVVGGVTVVALEPGAASSGLSGTPQLITPLSFVTLVTVVGVTSGGIDAESNSAYLGRLKSELQTMALRLILAADAPVFVRNIAGVYRATAIDNYRPDHNLLTPNQSSAETDTTGLTSGANCTVTTSATYAADGTKSFQLSSTDAGDMSVQTLAGTSAIPVVSGQLVTALASLRTGVSVRACTVSLRWYDAAGAFLSESAGTPGNDSASAFGQLFVTATAPATAAFAAVKVLVAATGGAAELHYVDNLAIRIGSSTAWSAGGTAATGQPKCMTIAAVDASGNAVGPSVKAAILTYLQSLREANFNFYAIDPTYSTITVTFSALALKGFDAADVKARTEAAVTAFLGADLWGQPTVGDQALWVDKPIVRVLKLAQIIENIAGVDEATTITINGAAADFTMPGPLPLPHAGTVTGTITVES